MRVYDVYRKRYRSVVPVFALAFADTPFRAAWALTCGHSGRSGCDKCALRSTRGATDGEQYTHNVFGGYTDLAPTLNFDERTGDWVAGQALLGQAGVFNPEAAAELLITHKKHLMRSRAAEQATTEEARNHPLPAAAAHGGCFLADPNSAEERALSEGGSFLRFIGL